MARIDIKRPKYIIPILILPFLALMNFAFARFKPEVEVTNLQTTAGINSEIPEPMLPNEEEDGKLEAFKKQLIEKRKHSNTNLIGEELEETAKSEVITPEEQRKIDSLQNLIQERKDAYQKKSATKKRQTVPRTKKRRSPSYTTTGLERSKKSEKDEFIEQMRIIDSIQFPEKYASSKPKVDPVLQEEQTEQKVIQRISLGNNDDSGFWNTVKKNNAEKKIVALLDEGVKVYEGSRVRIRLLQDTFVHDYLLKKGKYIYGEVEGFESHRVEINVNSIVVADSIVPVKITLYDNDGIRGIYVPDSQFRQFVSDLGISAAQSGNTMGAGIGQGQQGQGRTTEQLYRSVSRSINSATRAVSKALRKNKAFLKYNTQVYLINE
ncbi:conjugative transposon protein TraM [Flagellimonas flava]|uniref:conjugative transposon protein TraM n=1 Tax=Flagellimonas flava TaxID=570519 RepID=UPI003D64BE7D